jgi:hypothetical protein
MATTLKNRVESLELHVKRLQQQLDAAMGGRQKNWRAAVEKYTGDKDLQSVFAEAMKLREADRKRGRRADWRTR